MNGVRKKRPDIQIRRLKGNIAAISQQHKKLKEKCTTLAQQLGFSLRETNEKEAQAKKLYEALEALYQLQQGPPSLNHKEEWLVAMRLAKQTLEETKP